MLCLFLYIRKSSSKIYGRAGFLWGILETAIVSNHPGLYTVIGLQFPDHSLDAFTQILLEKTRGGFILRLHLYELLYMLLTGRWVVPHEDHPFYRNEEGRHLHAPKT